MKRLAAMTAPALLISLAACGGGSSDAAKSNPTSSMSTPKSAAAGSATSADPASTSAPSSSISYAPDNSAARATQSFTVPPGADPKVKAAIKKMNETTVPHQVTSNPIDVAKAFEISDYNHMCWPTDDSWGGSKTAQCTMVPKGGGSSVTFDIVTFKNKDAGSLAMDSFVGMLQKANGQGSEYHGVWNANEGWGLMLDGSVTDANLLKAGGPGSKIFHYADSAK